MAFASTSRVRACAVRSSVLSLLKANSISLKSGESGGCYNSCTPYFDYFRQPFQLMHCQVIGHGDIARPPRGVQHLVGVGSEDRSAHRLPAVYVQPVFSLCILWLIRRLISTSLC